MIKFKPEQLEKLNGYIIETIKMELQDDKITKVSEEIEHWKKAIREKEDLHMDKESVLQIINELEKFDKYLCSYAIDLDYGGCYGQAYIIVDKDCNYIDFVRTV